MTEHITEIIAVLLPFLSTLPLPLTYFFCFFVPQLPLRSHRLVSLNLPLWYLIGYLFGMIIASRNYFIPNNKDITH